MLHPFPPTGGSTVDGCCGGLKNESEVNPKVCFVFFKLFGFCLVAVGFTTECVAMFVVPTCRNESAMTV